MGKQKVNCKVFTPQKIVAQILDIIGYDKNLFGRKILENSCGDGRFLLDIVKRYIEDSRRNGKSDNQISLGLERDICAFEVDSDTHTSCIQNLNELLECYSIPAVKWNIFNEDALRANIPADFSYVIGNPPYITYSALSTDERAFIRGKFTVCAEGKPDYYYAFIESALKCLRSDGRLAYLLPSNFFKTRFAAKVRTYMLTTLTKIYDYKNQKVFDSALTASSIVVCDKKMDSSEVFYHDITSGIVSRISKEKLRNRWTFRDATSDNNAAKTIRFGNCFAASSSVATLCNSAFVVDKDSPELDKIEPLVLKKTISPKSAANRKDEQIIFPYFFDNAGNLQRYSEEEFITRFPNAAAHLESHRVLLDARNSDKLAKWFEYGRSQAIRHLNQKKLLLSTVITGKVKIYVLDENTIPYSGIYIVPNKGFNLLDAKHILESEDFYEYAKTVGIQVNGVSIRISVYDINNYMFSQ